MSEYPLHPDLASLSKLNVPANPALLAMGNVLLRLPFFHPRYRGIRCKKIRIRGHKSRITLRLYRPRNRKGNAPCLVYFHGGGFATRTAPQHYRLVQVYAEEVGCAAVLVDYVPCPFPGPAEDCFLAYRWIVEHARRLKLDPTRIAVGGDSAGGCLAAACCLMARDRRIPMPCFQMLVYPVTDHTMGTRSMAAFTDTPMWNSEKNQAMWQRYLSYPYPAPVEYASPMQAQSLAGLPDAYVETAEFDCLRDEGAAYAMRLQKSGSAIELYMSKGTVHGFEFKWKAQPTQLAIDRRVDALRRALG